MSHVPAGARWAGYPAQPGRDWLKGIAIVRRLVRGGAQSGRGGVMNGESVGIADIRDILRVAAASLPVFDGRSRHRHRGDEHAIGIKNVTMNEPQFLGHFPDNPVMPGVLVIEGMAQTAGIFVCG